MLFAILIIGYVAYAGVDVLAEYDEASRARDHALVGVVDPLAKKMLGEEADSVVIEKSIEGLSKIGSK